MSEFSKTYAVAYLNNDPKNEDMAKQSIDYTIKSLGLVEGNYDLSKEPGLERGYTVFILKVK